MFEALVSVVFVAGLAAVLLALETVRGRRLAGRLVRLVVGLVLALSFWWALLAGVVIVYWLSSTFFRGLGGF